MSLIVTIACDPDTSGQSMSNPRVKRAQVSDNAPLPDVLRLDLGIILVGDSPFSDLSFELKNLNLSSIEFLPCCGVAPPTVVVDVTCPLPFMETVVETEPLAAMPGDGCPPFLNQRQR